MGVLGLLLGAAFTLSAFAEPTASPANTTSYPPINVGPDTQYRIGKLGVGDGSALPGQAETDANALYTKGVFGTEALTVSKNATLVGNVTVNERLIVAGAIRAMQLAVKGTSAGSPGSESLYFAPGATTNLSLGNICTVSIGTNCPPGTMLYRSDFSANKSTCRFINPAAVTLDRGTCSSVSYPSLSVTLTGTSKNTNTCKATRTYSSNASGTTYWEIKTPNETEWTAYGTGSTKDVIVQITGNGPATVTYNLRARTVNSSGLANATTVNVSTEVDSLCSQYQAGGGSTGM